MVKGEQTDKPGFPLGPSVLALLPAAAYACDARGRIHSFNARAAELWGREPASGDSDERFSASLGLRWSDGTPMGQDQLPMAEALRTGRSVLGREALIEREDGSRVAIRIDIEPLRGEQGEMAGAVGVLHDLARSEADRLRSQLAAIVESSDDAILGKTLEGIITSWNSGAQALYGYSPDEIIGRPISMLVPPEAADDLPLIMGRLARGERITHYETVRRHKDGHRVEVSVTISPIRDGTGRIVGASAIARDIGERKRMERALREAELRKDEFLAVLGHELRNPLGAIATGMALLRRQPHGGADAPAILGTVSEQVSVMSRLVDDLLELTRLVRGRIRLRPERVELSAALRRTLELVRPRIEAGQLELVVSEADEGLELWADATRLEQILVNLVDHAVDSTPAGGRIRIATRREGEWITIEISDSGAGLSPSRQSTIFEPFSLEQEALCDGLQIGLALSRQLAELHGGTLDVKSEGQDQGCTFTLRLLEGGVEGTPRASEPVSRPSAQARRRILVVDDNHASAALLTLFLRERGHQVQQAETGLKALELAGEFEPEIVLLDLGLPGMDGYDVGRRLREMDAGMRIIALTGFGHADARRRTAEAGFDGHLLKGSDLDDLLEVIARVV